MGNEKPRTIEPPSNTLGARSQVRRAIAKALALVDSLFADQGLEFFEVWLK
jgi:hypothetical protein